MRLWRGIVLAIGICLALAGPSWAQSQITTGAIQGTVLDASGASVPAAVIVVTNLDTNLERDSNSDNDGRFVFLLLPPGRYTLKVSKQGFTTLVQQNLELTVGQTISLTLNLKISPGAESVVVTDTPVVDTANSGNTSTLNPTTIATTPVLGRKFEDLLTLTPGVDIVQGPDGDEINFNGQRGIFNNISMDGGDYNNGFFGEQYGGQRSSIDITLSAVQEFQVISNSASAEFGRTAGGVVNVITKSGTNSVHGDMYYYGRTQALTASDSQGNTLKDFNRSQFGGTLGGPIVRDKMFFFGAVEQITANLQRPNLSQQIGTTPCPQSTFNITTAADERLINGSPDCQRLALIGFYKTSLNQQEGLPVRHPNHNTDAIGKFDWNVAHANRFSVSYNFDRTLKRNETFDVPTYGDSANGIEGPGHIQTWNSNLFSTISASKLNEFHFTYARESRPRSAVKSNVPADTAMGFATSFRFGNPFFLQPNVNELFWRTQLRDSFSLISGQHTWKFGGDWLHSVNTQIFRGFFTGRYIFDSVDSFLRYNTTGGGVGFGPTAAECKDGTYTNLSMINFAGNGPYFCPNGSQFTGGPLLLYLQGAALNGKATDATGASSISNENFALFLQDSWKIWPNFTFNYGLRWEAQQFPSPVTAPSQTPYAQFFGKGFPSDGKIHNQNTMFQPRLGFAWDPRNNGKSVIRASWGIYNATQNMLTQISAITTNGVQQQTIFIDSQNIGRFGSPTPLYPGVITPTPVAPGTFPLFSGVHVFPTDYANPRIYTTNVGYEQDLTNSWAGYVNFTLSKGVHLTRFLNLGEGGGPNGLPVKLVANSDSVTYTGANPFSPQLGDIFVHASSAKSLYRGLTLGGRKRFSQRFQMEANYVLSYDYDDDSDERDPFTDRSFNHFNLQRDYALSDRDERHKFNFFTYAELPGGFNANIRMQAHSAQPITDNKLGTGTGPACSANNSLFRIVADANGNPIDCGRNHLRKDNAFFTFDWRLARTFKFGDRYELVPQIEMFNTFNNKNNIAPSVAPILFNFDGFLRQGVGDPRQAELSLKFNF